MKLVIICGPPASGKMTIGMGLEQATGLKLLHNHMTIEVTRKFFEFGTLEFERLDKAIRFEIFREVAQSDLPGMIFTMVWAFNETEDKEYIMEIVNTFGPETSCYFVELNAPLDVRLQRNRDEFRLLHKPSKRELELSEQSLLQSEKNYRMISGEKEIKEFEILKIDTSKMSSIEAVKKIKDYINE